MSDALNLQPPDEALWHLSAAVCDGTITSGELARLESILRDSAEARIFHVAYMDLHAQLLWRWRDGEVHLPEPWGIQHRGRRWWIGLASALAVSFVFLSILAIGLARGRVREPIAYLASELDCQWETESGRSVGQALYTEQELRLKGGVAEVAFRNGATVGLRGQVRVFLRSMDAIDVRRGKLSARVPEEAAGFSIRTPEATVVVHGTELGVLVDPAGGTEVHVFHGRVEVTSPRGKRQHVEVEEAVRVEAGRVETIELDTDTFTEERKTTPKRIELGEGSTGDSLDPATWRTVLPHSTSSIELAEDTLRLVNRAHFVTVEPFDPVVSGRLRISGSLRFPTFHRHATFHELNIVTRGDGRLPHQPGREAASGIVYTVSTKAPGSGVLEGSHAQIWSAGRSFRISTPTVVGNLEFSEESAYRFEIVDDGRRLSVTLSEEGAPANRVTVIATVMKDTSDSNLITFYGREQHDGKDIAVELSDLEITLGNRPE